MADFIHQNLAQGRWFNLTLYEQLGNVGSEVGRALKRQKADDFASRDQALARAFDLLDLTIKDSRWRARLKEICRAREVLADFFYGGNRYGSSPEALEEYFCQFARAARLRKGV